MVQNITSVRYIHAQKLYTTVSSRSELPFPEPPNKSWLQEEDQEEDEEEGEDEDEEEDQEEEDEEVKPCSAALWHPPIPAR